MTLVTQDKGDVPAPGYLLSGRSPGTRTLSPLRPFTGVGVMTFLFGGRERPFLPPQEHCRAGCHAPSGTGQRDTGGYSLTAAVSRAWSIGRSICPCKRAHYSTCRRIFEADSRGGGTPVGGPRKGRPVRNRLLRVINLCEPIGPRRAPRPWSLGSLQGRVTLRLLFLETRTTAAGSSSSSPRTPPR